jgi:sec-independent protein translocase protein TatA
MAFGLGTQELVIILIILLILFGGKKLPELARSLGSSVQSFKSAMKEGKGKKKKE